MKTLLSFKVEDEHGLICVLSAYSLKGAIEQTKTEITDAFDICIDKLIVSETKAELYGGEPGFMLILKCSKPIPQRLYDAR
jgi:hypothetical protein